MPATKRKKARCEINRLHNASRTSRPASLLSSPTEAPQCFTDFKQVQGLLLSGYSAHRRTTIDARSLLHRRRTSTASHQALGGGARGAGFDGFLQTATRLRRHHPLHSTGRRPAAGSDRLHCCGARGARQLRHHHPLHSSLAAGLQGCFSLGGLLAPTTPSFALYGPPSGSRLLPVAGLRRVGARRIQ